MISGTAASTVSFEQLGSGGGWLPSETQVAILARYRRLIQPREREIFSEARLPDAEVYRPQQLPPNWLEETERVINASIDRDSEGFSEDGRWLKQEVAAAANDFFREAADLLPSEPYVYSSRQGDLVAEFKAPHGSLTTVVSQHFVVLFAAVDEVAIQRKILLPGDLRRELTQVMQPLMTGAHGDLASGK
ncbi:MAG: hypothetical protein ABL986_00110 [Vicinamibacterales bacterium]